MKGKKKNLFFAKYLMKRKKEKMEKNSPCGIFAAFDFSGNYLYLYFSLF